ncbi:ornithine decarboxylase antizyme-domain-containing protein [Russula earlei]|uniref:Ornithine decarboxylase antizyme-domain-containing protein n=1 Tax=Russula earlei TaxID=71964 RepID=A0ACC0U0N6_9AGAM|nr:ornithine decarboxylase antizyme-domain-containing protein [Russula earlei]
MSNSTYLNPNKPISSPCPTNGRQTVGDGAFSVDAAPSVLAICQVQGGDNMYYYSTTFSGGPGSKCPPDRGSSDRVTGGPALKHPTTYNHSFYPSPLSSKDPRCNSRQNLVYPPTPPTAAADVVSFPPSSVGSRPIRATQTAMNFSHGLATPPLTPDDSFDDVSIKSNDDALELLTTLFPNHAMAALPYAKSVSITSPEMGTSFDGVVLELPGRPKTFYVDSKSAEVVNVRESIVALLDLADEHLQCSALVIALEKASPALSGLLHALMYVGGTVVTKPDFPVHPAYVLVGLEI